MEKLISQRIESLTTTELKPNFVEVSQIEEHPNVIEITANENTSADEVERKVLEELKTHNWWLQDYWKEKGKPKEKMQIETNFGSIELYNFSNELEQRHIKELYEVISFFNNLSNDNPLSKVKYILIDNIQHINPNTGTDMNGQNWNICKSIKIYPTGKSFQPHRVSNASNFQGTLIHELSHNLSSELVNKWITAFGWRELDEPVILAGGAIKTRECYNPENCVTEYARLSPSEDLCDSMIAAIISPNILDPHRLAFIKENILNYTNNTTSIEMNIEEPILPKLEKNIYFERKKPKKFTLI